MGSRRRNVRDEVLMRSALVHKRYATGVHGDTPSTQAANLMELAAAVRSVDREHIERRARR